MKKILLVPVILGLFAFSVHVSPAPAGAAFGAFHKPIAYALDGKGKVLDSAFIDAMGNYRFTTLVKGVYDVVIRSNDTALVTIHGVEHTGPAIAYHYQQQDPGILYGNLYYRTSKGRVTLSEKMEMTDYAPAFATRGSRMEKSKAPAAVSKAVSGEAMDMTYSASGKESESGSGVEGNKSIRAGQMTAGSWRDLDNWEKWNETNKDVSISNYQKEWGFYPSGRYSVQFIDAAGKPVIGYHVRLQNKSKEILWETCTDNLGRAETWAGLFSASGNTDKDLKISVTLGENLYEFGVTPSAGGQDVFKLPVNAETTAVADIAFVVDATGSMGDEIQYLQSELLDVTTRVKKQNQCLKLNIGSVFYRDHGDEYVTRVSDFTEDLTLPVGFIAEQSAGGGGDFPEAVDDAMEAAVNELKWSEKAIAKIMFLVLDAPPHSDAAVTEKVRKYTKIAAAKGIRIVPVVASGINQSTEFLMKYMAIATNGTYIYITDHSGIGNPHEKPTGVKENVQFLNDLMVDLITEYTRWDGCKDQPEPKPAPGKIEILTNGQWQVQVYPNPAKDFVTIKSNETPDQIAIYDIQGNLIKKIEQISPEKNQIALDNISTGVYLVRCIKGEKMISCRILVMK